MKSFKCFTAILLFSFTFQTSFSQNSSSIRQEVLSRLQELKPPSSKNYVYKPVVPQKNPNLPENLRLDIVYKIGHYDYEYVALRFEREKDEDFVNVTRFIYGSALDFWKEDSKYSKGDLYNAGQGKLAVKDFNYLLNLAFTFYQSNIEKMSRRNFGIGMSRTGSSGDGRIMINLSDKQNNSLSIINETGTLHAGNLKDRIENGYKDLKVHLFWKVFYDYFEKNNIFTDLEIKKTEEIAISRLKEPQSNKSYTDYYRQALYTNLLGEIGTAKSLPILEKLIENNGLEKDWDKYLSKDSQKAIEKIKSRETMTN